MIVIGLTGSIGMGKSTAAGMLSDMGCAVHSSDQAVHHLLSPSGAAFEEVAVTFPEAWDKKNHIIKRDILGQIVFDNENKRKDLENILHPLVQESQKIFTKKSYAMGYKFSVLDIPLLFETGADARVDYTFCVCAPPFIQAQRVLARPGMSKEKFEKIKQTQMPDGQKCALSDFVVETGLGRAYTHKTLKNILKKL